MALQLKQIVPSLVLSCFLTYICQSSAFNIPTNKNLSLKCHSQAFKKSRRFFDFNKNENFDEQSNGFIQNKPRINKERFQNWNLGEVRSMWKELSQAQDSSTRRKWIAQTTSSSATIGAVLTAQAKVATAESATIISPQTLNVESSASLINPTCDPTVSVWQRGSRKLYLLGTAHISAESAQLAGRLVREVKPQAVFVELDAKRVGRAKIPSATASGTTSNGETSGTLASSSSTIDSNPKTYDTTLSEPAAVGIRAREQPTVQEKINPFDVKAKIMRASQALIGDSIKKLYQKLESQGFSAGEEFAIAIREGLALNATIILGDRDVDVTLRRLTEAFAKTDITKLISADSEFEKTMESYFPDNMKESVKTLNGPDPDATTLSTFVETMKTKENVKNVMQSMKVAAPELYEALVGERDLYMANGMDKLQQFESMVSVMGIAHMDGVERNLSSWGWRSVKPLC